MTGIIFANKAKSGFHFFVLYFLFLNAGLFAQAGCQYPSDYNKFRQLPLERQRCEFSKLPLDKQIDFHLYSMVREPPDFQLGIYVAQKGKDALPRVLERFENEPEDYRKEAISQIFKEMHTLGYVNLNEEKDALDRIKIVVSKMTAPQWKEIAEKNVFYIESHSFAKRKERLPPPCENEKQAQN
jgi:hypothetical protein